MHLIYPDTAQFRAFRQISGVLKRAGFAVYAVGGAVRDLCLGKTPQDVDIATSAQPEELEKLFCDLKWVGRSFGVSLVKAGDFEFEVATFREERSYADGRHPEKLSFSRSPETDVRRRDFTVNALLADPWSGEVLDFTGGLNDLQMGIIRTVGDPETRFNEDHLRMLRALRFANRLGFELEESTFAALKRLAHLSSGIAGERVRQELENGFSCRPDRFLRLLDASGILEYILPEISHLKQVEQHQLYHPEGNVFNHTCKMLEHACGADTVLLWSILLHDIGKAETSFVDENGYVLDWFQTSTSNFTTATCTVSLKKDEEKFQAVALGDGPIDAAFFAIENIIGRHFELDDFQITAVTEGREAVGSGIVRLRSNGKLYSGKGISTDVIGAGIRAYVDALNKICYEENN